MAYPGGRRHARLDKGSCRNGAPDSSTAVAPVAAPRGGPAGRENGWSFRRLADAAQQLVLVQKDTCAWGQVTPPGDPAVRDFSQAERGTEPGPHPRSKLKPGPTHPA